MKINEFDNQLSKNDLDSLEVFADKVFGKVGIDVNFTRHFLDRVNDERNVKQISMGELTRLFKQEAKRWAKPIAQLGPDSEAVMKDLQTDLNLPFVLVWDDRNEELDLIAKTVMRKKNFKTSDKEFTIEATALKEDANKTNMVSPEGELRSILSQYVDTYIAKGWRIATRKDIHRKFTEDKDSLFEDSEIHKFNREDPNNPEVMIQGYGSLMLNQIEASVVRKLEELTKMAERGDFEQIGKLLDKDVMQTMIQSIVDTKAELQSIRKRGGPKSRGIAKSLYDSLTADIKIDEGMFDKLKVLTRKKNYAGAAESLHKMLQRKYKENGGKWRHSFSYYVAKIASGWQSVERSALNDYYLENYESAFITESGGVGKVVPGVNTTIDVGPDEIKKQAKKFGNAVDKDGLPKNTFR